MTASSKKIWLALFGAIGLAGTIGFWAGSKYAEPKGRTAYETAYLKSQKYRVSLKGDEVSFAQLIADAPLDKGASFVVFGGIKLGDVYAGPLAGVEATHYCFDFAEFNANFSPTGYDAVLYIRKDISKNLLEDIIDFNRRKGNVYMCARYFITFVSGSEDGTGPYPVFEIRDWQQTKKGKRGKAWQAWALGVGP